MLTEAELDAIKVGDAVTVRGVVLCVEPKKKNVRPDLPFSIQFSEDYQWIGADLIVTAKGVVGEDRVREIVGEMLRPSTSAAPELPAPGGEGVGLRGIERLVDGYGIACANFGSGPTYSKGFRELLTDRDTYREALLTAIRTALATREAADHLDGTVGVSDEPAHPAGPSWVAQIIRELIDAHPEKAEQARTKPIMQGWFVGQVMLNTAGKAHPGWAKEMVALALHHFSPDQTAEAKP